MSEQMVSVFGGAVDVDVECMNSEIYARCPYYGDFSMLFVSIE